MLRSAPRSRTDCVRPPVCEAGFAALGTPSPAKGLDHTFSFNQNNHNASKNHKKYK